MLCEKLKRQDFSFLKENGEKLKGRYFIFLYSLVSFGEAKAGFIVSKRHGKAVARNLQKRWIRSIYDANYPDFLLLLQKVSLLIIAVPSKGAYEEKREDFRHCLKKLERKILC